MQTIRIVSILIIVFLSVVLASAQGSAASAKDTAKNKEKITKWGEGSDVTVNLRQGKTLHGSITKIDADSFTVNEVDLRSKVDVRYDQVKNIQKGFIDASPITGHRPSPKTRRIVTWVVGGAAAALIVLVVVALATDHS